MYEIVALLDMLATIAALYMFTKDVVRMPISKRATGRSGEARARTGARGQPYRVARMRQGHPAEARARTGARGQGAKNGRRPAGGGGRATGAAARGSPHSACSLFLSIRIRSATLRLEIGDDARDAGCGA